MQEQIDKLLTLGLEAIKRAESTLDIERIRKEYLGKSGHFSLIMRNLKDVEAEKKPLFGMVLNNARTKFEAELEVRELAHKEAELKESLLASAIDISLPSKPLDRGSLHPITIIRDRLVDYFTSLGYELIDGAEIESDYYNFEALNIPADHPARDSQDTFFLGGGLLLRSQTSNAQIRAMEKGELPIKIISPGRVYRADPADASHSPVFHQLEGLVVDKGINMGHLKYVLENVMRFIFGEDTKTRLRTSFFPFTEPSVEVDVSCSCKGTGCKVCKNTGWIEVLGAGMVNRNVLSNLNIDPDIYSGFAFGFGLERFADLLFEIPDMRLLYDNDVRFLKQFN